MNLMKCNGVWRFEVYAPRQIITSLTPLLARMRTLYKPDSIISLARERGIVPERYVHGLEQFITKRNILWSLETNNIVVAVGRDDILDKYFKGSSYTAAHYIGLASSSPTFANGDTMSSHAGWTEVTAYDEANRQDFTPGTVSSQSVDNSAAKAVFTINADTTGVGGGFLTTNNTKGGSTGILVAGVVFNEGNRTLNTGETVSAQYTFSLADDGA